MEIRYETILQDDTLYVSFISPVKMNDLSCEIMGFTMALPKDILDHPIPYKYVVYSRRSALVQSLWEYLHGCRSRSDCNRILSLKHLTPDAEGKQLVLSLSITADV